MAYTSEQYKYLLLKRLQRHFSMTSITDRNYTYTFFGMLFDESVTVTEEAYNNFVKVMDDEIDYCSEHGIYCCENISTEDVETHSLVLKDAFAAIGIDLVISTEANEEDNYTATFTKPNGEVMVYEVSSGMDMRNYFYINARAGTEYNYAKLSAPYYNMESMEVLELSDCDINVCGVDCYWRYNADTATMTISGNGSYYPATTREDIGSGVYNTVIFGANVTRLMNTALDSADITTIVLLHAADFPLIIDESAANTKNAHTWDVYTDNLAFRAHNWGENASITWHTLDEWEG